jgi:hypothetical protein
MGALLDAIAAGQVFDAAMSRACGADTSALDAALRREIQAVFTAP